MISSARSCGVRPARTSRENVVQCIPRGFCHGSVPWSLPARPDATNADWPGVRKPVRYVVFARREDDVHGLRPALCLVQ
jgi:hypothetical protein